MAKPGFAEASSLVDPFKTFDFNIVFDPDIPGGGDVRSISYRAQATSVPGSQIDQVTTAYKGVELSFKGRRIWTKTWECTFVELRDISTRDIFQRWMDLIQDNATNSGSYAAQYKRRARVELYDGVPNLSRVVNINGLWPMQMGDMTLESASSADGTLSMTFSFDYTSDGAV